MMVEAFKLSCLVKKHHGFLSDMLPFSLAYKTSPTTQRNLVCVRVRQREREIEKKSFHSFSKKICSYVICLNTH